MPNVDLYYLPSAFFVTACPLPLQAPLRPVPGHFAGFRKRMGRFSYTPHFYCPTSWSRVVA